MLSGDLLIEICVPILLIPLQRNLQRHDNCGTTCQRLSSVGIESDSEQLDKLISELDGKDLSEILTSGEALLAKFGSGGGGGGGGGGTFIFLLVLYINYVII